MENITHFWQSIYMTLPKVGDFTVRVNGENSSSWVRFSWNFFFDYIVKHYKLYTGTNTWLVNLCWVIDTNKSIVMLTLNLWAPSREAINTILKVFGMTGLSEPLVITTRTCIIHRRMLYYCTIQASELEKSDMCHSSCTMVVTMSYRLVAKRKPPTLRV